MTMENLLNEPLKKIGVINTYEYTNKVRQHICKFRRRNLKATRLDDTLDIIRTDGIGLMNYSD